MSKKNYSVRKYIVSTVLVTSLALSPVLTGSVFAHGGPDAGASQSTNNTPVTKQVKHNQTSNTNSAIVSKGDRGDTVKDVQAALTNKGFTTNPDGIFGANTDAAVRDFQQEHTLSVDGKAGPATMKKLAVAASTQNDKNDKQVTSKTSSSSVSKGDRGEAVKDVQTALTNKGYTTNPDGIFGSNTDTAVRDFQRDNALSVDGKAGPATMKTLATASTKGEGLTIVDAPKEQTKSESVETPADSAGGIVATAKSLVGTPYKFGGTTPAAFDSSGFINYVFAQEGINLNRTHAAMWANDGVKVDKPSVGDVVFFSGTYKSGISHSGIYLGNNKMAHAGTEKTGVEITDMSISYWQNHYVGAKSFK